MRGVDWRRKQRGVDTRAYGPWLERKIRWLVSLQVGWMPGKTQGQQSAATPREASGNQMALFWLRYGIFAV